MGIKTKVNQYGPGSKKSTRAVMSLIPAYKKGQALIAEMDTFHTGDESLRLWWLGQSGFLIQWHGNRLLLDPYLSDSLTHKYTDTDKPHVRMSELVVGPELLRDINVVTSSHNHTDHLDAETLIPILKNNPGIHMIIPEANRSFVADRLNINISFPIGLNDGQSVTVGAFTFYGIPAKHNEIDRDDLGHCRYMGYIIQCGPYTIYHSGDTLWFEGIEALLKPYAIDIALLPINGDEPKRKVAGNLNTHEAAALGKAIGAKLVIPCHYDLFEFNTADVSEFVVEAKQLGQNVIVLKLGEFATA
jgi:L-ascorbate metabolism protein UlaG (beta-lactamase superfamily)